MTTPFITTEYNQVEPYTTIRLRYRVPDKDRVNLYYRTQDNTRVDIDKTLWTLNNRASQNTEVAFYSPHTVSGVLYIELLPMEFLATPVQADPNKALQSSTVINQISELNQSMQAIWNVTQSHASSIQSNTDEHVKLVEQEHRLDSLVIEFQQFKKDHSQDVTPNPDNPPTDALKALRDQLLSDEVKINGLATLTEQQRQDLVALQAELHDKLPAHGTHLSTEEIQIILKAMTDSGKFIDHTHDFKILAYAARDSARLTLSDGSARDSKGLLKGSHKPVYLEKDMQPDPHNLVPVRVKVTLGQTHHVAAQDLLNRLSTGQIIFLTDEDILMLTELDASVAEWLPTKHEEVTHYLSSRIKAVLYKIPGTGYQTALNLTEMFGDTNSKATPQYIVGVYESDETVRKFNRDGTELIVDGNYVNQKVKVPARMTGDQIAKLLATSTWGKNLNTLMLALSHPKTEADQELPINFTDNLGIPIKSLTDLSTVEHSYHQLYDIKPNFISFANGLSVIKGSVAGLSKFDGTDVGTKLKSVFGIVYDENGKETIAAQTLEALIGEVNMIAGNNLAHLVSFFTKEKNRRESKADFFGTSGSSTDDGMNRQYADKTAAEKDHFHKTFFDREKADALASASDYNHLLQRLKNPQDVSRRSGF